MTEADMKSAHGQIRRGLQGAPHEVFFNEASGV